MRQDHNTVLGEMNIRLHTIRTRLYCLDEGFNRVFWKLGFVPSMRNSLGTAFAECILRWDHTRSCTQ